jgi:ABC-2 type transport system permease protein
LVGILFVLPLLFISPALQNSSQNFLPHPMANSMTAVKPLAGALSPGVTFALLCLYAIVVLAAGAAALNRRDAYVWPRQLTRPGPGS